MIILCDYDGTVIPQILDGYCNVDTGAERVLKKLIRAGHLIVLWTCRNNSLSNPNNYINGLLREESSLDEAVRWFTERNIPLYGVNYIPGEKEKIGKSAKPLADLLIDDTALGAPLTWGNVSYVSYSTGEIIHNYYTHCIDWRAVEAILVQQKIIDIE